MREGLTSVVDGVSVRYAGGQQKGVKVCSNFPELISKYDIILPQNFWWNLHLETTKALKALHRDLLHGLHQLIVFLRTKSRMAERKFDQARDGRKILILKDHFVSLSQDKLNQI